MSLHIQKMLGIDKHIVQEMSERFPNLTQFLEENNEATIKDRLFENINKDYYQIINDTQFKEYVLKNTSMTDVGYTLRLYNHINLKHPVTQIRDAFIEYVRSWQWEQLCGYGIGWGMAILCIHMLKK